jgi:branched-chain amino acid transport system ATP-binding protein
MTVEENLEMGAYARKDKSEIEKDMEEILQLFPAISERRKQKAGTLSGGEQQLLTIARALMAKPKLLILDEPTASLAPAMVNQVYQKIAGIRDMGVTMLLAEQNVKGSLKISDKACVIVSGRKILEGSAEEILTNKDLAKIFLGAIST